MPKIYGSYEWKPEQVIVNGRLTTQYVLTKTDIADVKDGTDGNDEIYGLGGADTLRGGRGNDTLSGGGQDGDRLEGGEGTDTADYGVGTVSLPWRSAAGDKIYPGTYPNELAKVEVDLAAGTATLNGARRNTLSSIENVDGSQFDDTLKGDGGANRLDGGSGADVLEGRGGNDTLIGGGGKDTLRGDAGNDLLMPGYGDDLVDGGADVDTVDYSDKGSPVRLDLGAGEAKVLGAGGAATQTNQLVSIENAHGGSGNDTLIGSAEDNRLEGRGGDDSLGGGTGQDTLLGGDGKDTLDGGAGQDRLDGGAGVDRLIGGADEDVFVFRRVLDSAMGKEDTIVDFAGETIDLTELLADAKIDPGAVVFGAAAWMKGDRKYDIGYDPMTGLLRLDVDDSGAYDAKDFGVQFGLPGARPPVLEKNLLLAAPKTTSQGGTTGGDTLAGGGITGGDTLLGSGITSGETLAGGGTTGGDTLLGGGIIGGETLAGGGITGGDTLLGGGITSGETLAGGGATGGETLLGGGITGGETLAGGGITGGETLSGGGTPGGDTLLGGGAGGWWEPNIVIAVGTDLLPGTVDPVALGSGSVDGRDTIPGGLDRSDLATREDDGAVPFVLSEGDSTLLANPNPLDPSAAMAPTDPFAAYAPDDAVLA